MTEQFSARCARIFRRFLNATGATAAVEFALVLPILASIAVTLPDVGNLASGDMNMEAAVRASAQYAMNGGSDMATARAIGMSSWTSKPDTAALTTSKACLCGAVGATCGQICQDGSLPVTYVTVTASATLGGTVISLPLSTTQVVRIQ